MKTTLNIMFYLLLIMYLLFLVGCDSKKGDFIDTPNINVNSDIEYSGEQKVGSPITIRIVGAAPELSYGFKIMPMYQVNQGFQIHGKEIVHVYDKPGTYFIKGAGQDINGIWTLTNAGKKITIYN